MRSMNFQATVATNTSLWIHTRNETEYITMYDSIEIIHPNEYHNN